MEDQGAYTLTGTRRPSARQTANTAGSAAGRPGTSWPYRRTRRSASTTPTSPPGTPSPRNGPGHWAPIWAGLSGTSPSAVTGPTTRKSGTRGWRQCFRNWRSASPAGRMWKRNWNAGNWERFSAAGWTPSPGRSGTSSSGGTGTARRCRIWPGRRASPPTRPPSGFSACGGCCEPCWNGSE